MASKRKKHEEEPITPAAEKKTGSRHKKRNMVNVTSDIYERLVALAKHNNRPISWQLRMLLMKSLREEGYWPPPEDNTK